MVVPWSRCSNRVATGRRVPRKHHVPPSFPPARSTALQRFQSIRLVYRWSARAGIVAKMNKALDEAGAGDSRRMASEGRTPLLKKSRWLLSEPESTRDFS
jgi:hypothetical protein